MYSLIFNPVNTDLTSEIENFDIINYHPIKPKPKHVKHILASSLKHTESKIAIIFLISTLSDIQYLNVIKSVVGTINNEKIIVMFKSELKDNVLSIDISDKNLIDLSKLNLKIDNNIHKDICFIC